MCDGVIYRYLIQHQLYFLYIKRTQPFVILFLTFSPYFCLPKKRNSSRLILLLYYMLTQFYLFILSLHFLEGFDSSYLLISKEKKERKKIKKKTFGFLLHLLEGVKGIAEVGWSSRARDSCASSILFGYFSVFCISSGKRQARQGNENAANRPTAPYLPAAARQFFKANSLFLFHAWPVFFFFFF